MRRTLPAVTLAVLAMTGLGTRSAHGQDFAELGGLWTGEISTPAASLQIIFNFTTTSDGDWVGTISVPAQGVNAAEMSSVTFQDANLIVEIEAFQATYRGTVVEDELQGTWSQAGNAVELNMTRTTEEALATVEEEGVGGGLSGEWRGDLNAGAAILPLVFTLERRADDSYFGHLVSPAQGPNEYPFSSVRVEGEEITITIDGIAGSFTGTIDGDTIEGTFTQVGQSFPLTISRGGDVDAPAGPVRPQNPEEPFPYDVEEVEFTNPTGGHTLAGTITVPVGSGPHPAAILVTGSGPQDRDESIAGHKPFLVLADHLTRNGIAVLRYDDRGVGESGGDFSTATTTDLTQDANAAWTHLAQREDIDSDRVGVIGHSEGALIASIMGANNQIAFAVLLAGPGVRGDELLFAQGDAILEANGGSAEMRRLNRSLQEALFAGAMGGDTPGQLTARLNHLLDEMSEHERAVVGFNPSNREMLVQQQVTAVSTPWFREFLTLDPAAYLSEVRIPLLALVGEKDLQVPFEMNLAAIDAALTEAGNTQFETRALPDLNHLFQTAETGSPTEYATIEETMSPVALEAIVEWIRRFT